MANSAFWRDKRVFVTGHTGFKGAWLNLWLDSWDATVKGYALPPPTAPSLAASAGYRGALADDIGDGDRLTSALRGFEPDIVVHLAAQALVPYGVKHPIETFETNVLGTAKLLHAVAEAPSVRTVLVVTSDKVYRRTSDEQPFREDDPLGGRDPYSASKAAAEHVVTAWQGRSTAQIVTARAGNVIGGGDWASERLVPDVIRAWREHSSVVLRQPSSTRPWQHVLDVLDGYLRLIEASWDVSIDLTSMNFGPTADPDATASMLVEQLGAALQMETDWTAAENTIRYEAPHLMLNSSLANRVLGWKPRLDVKRAVDWTAEWYRNFYDGAEASALCRDQIARHQELPI